MKNKKIIGAKKWPKKMLNFDQTCLQLADVFFCKFFVINFVFKVT